MPAIGFVYPDGEKILFKDCFNGCLDEVRMGVNIPMLKEMSKQRPANRKPSTTELLKGTLEAYLERTFDYYIDPQKRAFALVGTLQHAKLEGNTEKENAEILMEIEGITGIADLYDPKTKTLTDYKNTGSFKAAKVLGITYDVIDDPDGEVYKRSGKWGHAGQPKQVKFYYQDKNKAEFGDWAWQLNLYRMMIEKNGQTVEQMHILMIVRDGGLKVARERGIKNNIYLVEIPFIPNEQVFNKFIPKRDALLNALKTGKGLPQCTEEERWKGNKCKYYCEVAKYCPYIEQE